MSLTKAYSAARVGKSTTGCMRRSNVYRLEDACGKGPYSGDQVCVPYLKPHADPLPLLRLFGYPDEVLKALSKAGFVFGWSTKKDYRSFFKPGGQMACEALGFKLQVFKPTLRFDLPDGQVLFAKSSSDFLQTPMLSELLQALSKMRRSTLID